MVSDALAHEALQLEKRMGQLITSRGAKALTAYYDDRRKGGTRTDLEVEVRMPTHLDPEAMALAMYACLHFVFTHIYHFFSVFWVLLGCLRSVYLLMVSG